MNWALFCSTFVMIFLAELGDKTQLAVMSQSGANSSFKLTVFVAGALALAASTAIGVLAGGLLQRLVPDERYIKVAGGLLFLLFGLMMLREGFAARQVDEPPVAAVHGEVRNVLGRLVLRQAAAFERAALNDYRQLIKKVRNQPIREVLARIAAEEEGHSKIMGSMETSAGETAIRAALPDEVELIHDVAAESAETGADSDRALLEHAIAHELATVAFYRALSHGSTIPALRVAFARAAADEERHAAMMKALLTQADA